LYNLRLSPVSRGGQKKGPAFAAFLQAAEETRTLDLLDGKQRLSVWNAETPGVAESQKLNNDRISDQFDAQSDAQ
jgi:hypothetical protein